jgi:hypothetical protein
VAKTGTDADDLVGGDCGADSATADKNTETAFLVIDGASKVNGAVWIIVARVWVVSAKVKNVVAQPAKFGHDRLGERNSSVVSGDSNSHFASTPRQQYIDDASGRDESEMRCSEVDKTFSISNSSTEEKLKEVA